MPGYSAILEVPGVYPTIQSAIDAASAGDTVRVAAGTYVENIDFKGKGILVTSSDGAALTVIDGNQAGSVSKFVSGEGLDAVLEGFTLTNGSGTEDGYGLFHGGGIYMEDASPTIQDNIITENAVANRGGGIACYGASSANIMGNTLSLNESAWDGAGIYCEGSAPLISDNLIEKNIIGTPFAEGGGIYCGGGASPAIRNNTLLENEGLVGGGICSRFSSPEITGNILGYNLANAGGGIYCSDYSEVMANNLLFENTAGIETLDDYSSGGGILLEACDGATLVNNTLYGNSSFYTGGGISLENGSSVTVANTILWHNNAFEGPGIWIEDDVTLSVSYSNLEGGKASVYVEYGGILDWGPGMIDADPCFDDEGSDDYHLNAVSPCLDSGDNGAAGIPGNDFEGDVRIFDGDGDGSAVVDMGCDEKISMRVPLDYATIQAAIAAAPEGEGILVAPGTYVENIDYLGKAVHLKSTEGAESTVIDGNGVASVVTFVSGEWFGSVLEGFTVTNGHASCGGGINCLYASPTLIRNIICNNKATDAGGGICCKLGGPVIHGNTIEHNDCSGSSGGGSGGGLACINAWPAIANNHIAKNTTWQFGGGIFFCQSTSVLVNNVLHGNGGCYDGGGIAIIDACSLTLTNNSLHGNMALSSGGGIFCDASSVTVSNTILWNDTAPSGPEIEATSITVAYCDVQGGWPGTGNIDEDPMFVDPATGDFHLDMDSPCLEKGDNGAAGLPTEDFEGDPRIVYEKTDMGADEYNEGGKVFLVPADYPTIQAAIDYAADNDSVLVSAGTYIEQIDFHGKSVALKSVDGPETTIIDAKQIKSVVTIDEGGSPLIEGFTLTNGYGSYWPPVDKRCGGGIYCVSSSPVIKNNIVCDNLPDYHGGGIFCHDASPTIIGNRVFGNVTNSAGGGIYSTESDMSIYKNKIYENSGGNGGGIYSKNDYALEMTNNLIVDNSAGSTSGGVCVSGSDITIMNCTVSGNSAFLGGGIKISGSTGTITNSIIYGNTANHYPDILISSEARSPVSYCCIKGVFYGEGNINDDPLFVDPSGADFSLDWRSPCINRGNNDAAPIDDLEGHPRPWMGTVDMGAYEFTDTHPLEADVFTLSEATGGTIHFDLEAGSAHGNWNYFIFLSISGTAPGTAMPGELVNLPINWDFLTDIAMGLTLQHFPVFIDFYGKLDPAGQATATFDTLGPIPGTAGATFSFAFPLAGPPGAWEFVSNPINVEVLP
jgi:hypothetical protein